MFLSEERKSLVLGIACEMEDKEFWDQRLLITLQSQCHISHLLHGHWLICGAGGQFPNLGYDRHPELASTIICQWFLSTNELSIFLGKQCIYLRNKSSVSISMIAHNSKERKKNTVLTHALFFITISNSCSQQVSYEKRFLFVYDF